MFFFFPKLRGLDSRVKEVSATKFSIGPQVFFLLNLWFASREMSLGFQTPGQKVFGPPKHT